MSNIVQGHILKFLEKQRAPSHASRRLFPEEKIGQSKESPDWFKRKFSLQPSGGYQYKHDEHHVGSKFKYQSQKNSFFVNQHENKQDHLDNAGKTVNNLKKGLLSQYLDKNICMKAVFPLTGFERGVESRKLSNRDKQKNIQKVQFQKSAYITARTTSNFYNLKISNPIQKFEDKEIKPSDKNMNSNFQENQNPENLIIITGKSMQEHTHQSKSKSIPSLIGLKEKIRSQRMQLFMNKIHKIEKMKIEEPAISRKIRTIDSQFVKNRMALTAREWGGKKTSLLKSIERFDTMIGWSDRSEERIHRGIFVKKAPIKIESDNLMELFQEKYFQQNQI